jgi:hypothetical protein
MIKKIKVYQSNNLIYMFEEKYVIEENIVGTSWLIFSFSLLVIFLILWLPTKGSYLAGVIAFLISSVFVIGYCTYLNFKLKKGS